MASGRDEKLGKAQAQEGGMGQAAEGSPAVPVGRIALPRRH